MRSSPFSLTTRISVTPNVSTPDRQDGLYSSHGSISPSPIVHATRSLRQMLYPIKIPPKSAPKSLSPSCLPNLLSVPFSGPSTNRSFPPMLPSHLRRGVLPATPTFPELNAITSYTLLIPLWALAIQGPTAPSQYCKIASGGPIDPFNVCKHRKPRLGARAAWGQKNGAANRPAYCVKEKQTSLIER